MYGAITKQGGDEGRGFSQSDSRPADDEEEARGSVEVLARDEPNSPESHHPIAGEGDRRKDRAYSYDGIEGGTERCEDTAIGTKRSQLPPTHAAPWLLVDCTNSPRI